GGTFDASLVTIDGIRHEVESSLGLNQLGGDDFDTVLADLALERAGSGPADADARRGTAYLDLLEQAREAKERLAPQSRRIVLDVDGEPVTVPVEEFYEAAAPLVAGTMEAMA